MIGSYTLQSAKMKTKMTKVSGMAMAYLNKPYSRHLTPDEGGGYVASIQEFPGCIAEGDTAEEAIHNLNKAAESWVEVALANGYEIRDPVNFLGHSGKVALRIPRGLHKQIAELAEMEECSVNNLLVTAISEYVGRTTAVKKLSDAICSEMRKLVSDGLISLYRQGPALMVFSLAMPSSGYYVDGTTIDGNATEKIYSLGDVSHINQSNESHLIQNYA